MAEINTVIAEASQDLQTIEDFVNLPADSEVYPRLLPSVNVGTLAGARQAIFEAGGLPATPFATKALMTASPLIDGDYAMVTDDTVNNGLYVKTAGAWVKSAYDPVTQATTYTDSSITTALNKSSGTFDTLALLTASTLVDNTYALVANDTDATKNGHYKKISGVWTKVGYQPVTQAKDYTDNLVASNLRPDIDLSSYVPVRQFPSTVTSKWIASLGYTGFAIPVKQGLTYTIKTGATISPCLIYPMKEATPQTDGEPILSKLVTLAPSTTTNYTVPDGHNYLWVAHTNENRVVLPTSIKETKFTPVLRSDIANSIYDNGATKVPSLTMSKKTQQDVDSIAELVATTPSSGFEKLNIEPYLGDVALNDKALFPIADVSPNVQAVTISLLAGDVLSFEYLPFYGVVLWQKGVGTKVNAILSGQAISDKPKSFTFTAYKDMEVYLANHKPNTIKKNGVVIDSLGLTYLKDFARVTLHTVDNVYKPNASYMDYKSLPDLKLKKGDTVKITNVGTADLIAVRVVMISNPLYYAGMVSVAPDNPDKEVIFTATGDCTVRLTGHKDSEFYIKRAVSIKNALINNSGAVNAEDIGTIYMPPRERVFATHQNYILKMEMIDGVENIAFSENLGKTWTYGVNNIGQITTYHFFTDGTIMLCSKTRVYWSTDGVNYTESVIYDHDGSVYTAPEGSWRFFNQQNGDRPMFVDGQEMFVWGEYVRGANTFPAIFYTTDFGRTIKTATRFGKSVLDGAIRPARHVHRIYFHDAKEDFYIATGDSDPECHLIKAKYNMTTDTWTWDIQGTGSEWKFGTMWVDKFYLYVITDYTTQELRPKSGIYRVSLGHLRDINKYKMIYHADVAEWGNIAPFRLIVDRNGNKVQLGDVAARGYIWVATDGLNFKKVKVAPNLLLSYIIGSNYNGDIYCSGNYVEDETQLLSEGTYNLTTALRNAGLTNFMRGEKAFENLISITE